MKLQVEPVHIRSPPTYCNLMMDLWLVTIKCWLGYLKSFFFNSFYIPNSTKKLKFCQKITKLCTLTTCPSFMNSSSLKVIPSFGESCSFGKVQQINRFKWKKTLKIISKSCQFIVKGKKKKKEMKKVSGVNYFIVALIKTSRKLHINAPEEKITAIKGEQDNFL